MTVGCWLSSCRLACSSHDSSFEKANSGRCCTALRPSIPLVYYHPHSAHTSISLLRRHRRSIQLRIQQIITSSRKFVFRKQCPCARTLDQPQPRLRDIVRNVLVRHPWSHLWALWNPPTTAMAPSDGELPAPWDVIRGWSHDSPHIEPTLDVFILHGSSTISLLNPSHGPALRRSDAHTLRCDLPVG